MMYVHGSVSSNPATTSEEGASLLDLPVLVLDFKAAVVEALSKYIKARYSNSSRHLYNTIVSVIS
jgi:hypothetical protein